MIDDAETDVDDGQEKRLVSAFEDVVEHETYPAGFVGPTYALQ